MKLKLSRFFKNNRRKKIVIALAVLILFLGWFFSLPEPVFNEPYSPVVFDENEELVGARLASDGQWRFPTIDSVPHKLERCMLFFEDEYFYYHPGVNPLSMGRAVYQNIKAKRILSGGSTISMQVIRLSRGQTERTFF